MVDVPLGAILTPVLKLFDKWRTPREKEIDNEFLDSLETAQDVRKAGGEFRWSRPEKVEARIASGYSEFSYREKWYQPKTVFRDRSGSVLMVKMNSEAK